MDCGCPMASNSETLKPIPNQRLVAPWQLPVAREPVATEIQATANEQPNKNN